MKNFAGIDRKTGEILVDYIFDNSVIMIRDFAIKMESNGVKPEVEVYDLVEWAVRVAEVMGWDANPPHLARRVVLWG